MGNFKKLCLIAFVNFIIFGCGGGGSVSILPTSDAFDESDLNFNPNMDILWVVDPSRSMYDKVEKVRNNIEAFVTDFINEGYQYQMGVISTAAWSHEEYVANNSLTYLLDGSDPLFARLHSGECVDYANTVDPILNYLTADNLSTFMQKFQKVFDVYGVSIGTSGCGLVGPPFRSSYTTPPSGNIFSQEPPYDDSIRGLIANYIDEERPLQSMRAFLTLDHAKPSGPSRFLRDDAYLAVIIITDEPDSSAGTAQEYVDFLTTIKGSTDRFAVYTITDPAFTDHKSAQVAALTGGSSLNIHGTQQDYINNLNSIKNAILVEATAYPLNYAPVVNSIVVEIIRENGTVVAVPQSVGGGPGWTYNPATQTLSFSEEYLPTPKDAIVVNYTPATFVQGVSKQPRLDLTHADVAEGSANSTTVGTISLRNGNADHVGVFAYTIESDTSTGGFGITTNGETAELFVADTSRLDADDKSRHEVEVKLTVTREDSSTEEVSKTFLIRILDVPDSDPIANDDAYTVSASNADPSGNIFVTGNVSYNDTGLDASETHTFSVTTPASAGNASFVSNGVFNYNVNFSELTFTGNEAVVTFVYEVAGTVATPPASTPASDTATVTITILRDNQNPIIATVLPDRTINFTASEEVLAFNASDVTSFHIESGSIADLVNTGSSSGLTTRTGTQPGFLGTPFVELSFPSVKSYFEVLEFRIEGGHSLGNAVLQVLDANDRVLTREIIGVDDGGGSSGANLTIPVQRAVIGRKIKILRPQGSVNPQGDQRLSLDNVTVYGREAFIENIDLNTYFSDPDMLPADPDKHCASPSDPRLDCLTYYITDEYGEGAAPAWATLAGDGHNLRLIPPAGADAMIGVLAVDKLGATAFQKFRVQRIGSGSIQNASPISLLALDDAKRGGITLKRFGGENETTNPNTDNKIRHGENDNFLLDPYAGEAIRAAIMAGDCNGSSGVCSLQASGYRTNPNSIPSAIRSEFVTLGISNQTPHFGDNYGGENGWSNTPIFVDEKYPSGDSLNPLSTTPPYAYPNRNFSGRCYSSAFMTGSNNSGKIYPCITGTGNDGPNDVRGYGETYTGYFVPAKTGVYRFRTQSVDDVVQLQMAPTEYQEDLLPVFTANHANGVMVTMMASLYSTLGGQSPSSGNEFATTPNAGHPTQIFFGSDQTSYQHGYVLLKQGNVYVIEIRFAEGGGVVAFDFEYSRKDQGTNTWDDWKAIDASVVVPSEGGDRHDPMIIVGSSLPFDAKALFYDAEDDALEYTARLVNPNGTQYGSGAVEQIGLSMGSSSGMLSGTLNSTYTSLPEAQRPRVIFKAKERFTSAEAEVESLAIKLQP
ncbi:MAG: hypothetical protein M9899_10845 [Bdellovibrionaceae bacterium]|nr:hypothetical protein [Pseudobdellovibrionaceae bacterium]